MICCDQIYSSHESYKTLKINNKFFKVIHKVRSRFYKVIELFFLHQLISVIIVKPLNQKICAVQRHYLALMSNCWKSSKTQELAAVYTQSLIENMKIILVFLVASFGQSLGDIKSSIVNYSLPYDAFKYSFNTKYGNLTWINNSTYEGRHGPIELHLNRTITSMMVRSSQKFINITSSISSTSIISERCLQR